MKVLVAVDDSKWSRAAIDFMKRLTWPADTQMIVLSVAPVWVSYTFGDFIDTPATLTSEFLEQDRQSHEAIARRNAKDLREICPQVRAECVVDDPRQAIVSFAKREVADLVVVGSHGRSGLKKLLMGSVSSHVVTHAHCNVLVAKLDETE